MAKSREKIEAIKLRKNGKSIKWIAKKLQVSPGSVSVWCRDIKLSADQISQLEKQGKDPMYGKRLEYALEQKRIRNIKTKLLMKQGVDEIGQLTLHDLLLVGTALYWAEGYKKDGQVGLGSSDPEMMKTYVSWLIYCFGCSIDDLLFRVTFNESHKYREGEIISFWAKTFEITEDRFQKPFYQKAKWQKVYSDPENYFGVLRIRVRKSSDMLRKIKGHIEGVKSTNIL